MTHQKRPTTSRRARRCRSPDTPCCPGYCSATGRPPGVPYEPSPNSKELAKLIEQLAVLLGPLPGEQL